MEVQVGGDLLQGQRLWVQQTWVWHKSSLVVAIYPTIELPELTQDWEIDSRRAQQNLVHQDPGEKSSDPTGDCPGLACGCLGVSGGGVGLWWSAAWLGAVSVAEHAWDLLKEVTMTFITSTIVSVQFSSVAQSCPTLCDPMNHSTPGVPVHQQLPEFTQTHVH